MSNVIVIDSIMGSGKTSFAIQTIKEAPQNQKFIFVTPFLDEVIRIKEALPERNFREPDTKNGEGTKLKSLKKLIANGDNIVTTHALFSMIDSELRELLQWESYTLVLDEVMNVVNQVKTKKHDIQVMIDARLIEIKEDGQVLWIADSNLQTKYDEIKYYALAGNLYSVNGTAFFWNFPSHVFNLFDQVFILTYLFDGQIQKYYYDFHGVKYVKKSVFQENGKYKLSPYFQEDRTHFKSLIQIYEGKLNEVGDKDYSLSKKWFKSKPAQVSRLKHDLYNYLRNVQKAKSDEILWTTFKDFHDGQKLVKVQTKLQGKGFSKKAPIGKPDLEGKACFVPFTTRATNRYKHKRVLAFCLNRFMNPVEEHFFRQRNVKVEEDLLALSDLLQWVFRSCIREGQPIQIYIPSKRMRNLLKMWLDGKI